MKTRPMFALFLLAYCVAASCSAGRQAGVGGALRPAGSIPLPQVRGRIDHMAVDVKGGRLFVAALGNNTLEVVDLDKGVRVNSVSGFDEPQGLVYIPEAGRVVVANGGDGVVTFLDGQSLKTLKIVRTEGDADNVRYDSSRGRVYVGYGDGALAVLSAAGERVGDVRLGGHPESFQLDGGRIYVNVPSRHEVAVVDADTLKVAETWPVTDAAANFPMALDAARHRLFVVTRRPQRLLVYDTATGKTVSTAEAGGDSDDIFYDGERGRVYASFGEGSVFVYERQDADRYRLAAKVQTAAGARTALYSPELGRLFVAAPGRGDRTAEIMIYRFGS